MRERYKGPLTYSASYDEYRSIPFWKDLDVIGIDAYRPLADEATTDPTEPGPAWQPIADDVAAFQGKDWWAGVCWWMWDDWPDTGETPKDLAYSPLGNPAEQVLRKWWAPGT